MSHQLILAGLSLLTREFAVAHPSKPSKGFLRAEVEKLLALVEGLPDEDAPAPTAAKGDGVTDDTAAIQAGNQSSPAPLDPQGGEPQQPSQGAPKSA